MLLMLAISEARGSGKGGKGGGKKGRSELEYLSVSVALGFGNITDTPSREARGSGKGGKGGSKKGRSVTALLYELLYLLVGMRSL